MAERIGICDSDQYYGIRFLEYIQSSNLHYEICLFTNLDSLYEYLHANDLEYLFIEQALYEEDIHKFKIKMIYMLINHPEIKTDVNYLEVFKYQAVEDILQVITKEKAIKKDALKITVVYTIHPSMGSLAFSWSYALSISNYYKTLFIPLDFYPVALISSQSKELFGVSDMIYYLKENKSDYLSKWRKQIKTIVKLDYMGGVTHGFDLLTLNEEDIEKWISSLCDMKEYENVVFFISMDTPAMSYLLNLSNHVVYLKANDLYEMKKEEEWKRQRTLMSKEVETTEWSKVELVEDPIFYEKVSFSLEELYETMIWKQAKSYVDREE